MGLVTPDAGDILVNDDLVATAKKSLREPQQRGVGMVFQDVALWPHMTARENIEFGLGAKRIPEKQRRQPILHNQPWGTFFGGNFSTTFSPGSRTGRVAEISRTPGRSQSPSGRKRTIPPLSSVIASG